MGTFDLENPDPNPGDGLRDEAANLLESKYGRPKREYRTAGKKADLYFSFSELGRENRVYVEAKDYNRPLRRDEVVAIAVDYQGALKSTCPTRLLIVTRSGLSADAQAFIINENDNLAHQTIWELENELLGLTEYTRYLSEQFESTGLASYYIAARANSISYNDDGSLRSTDPKEVAIFETLKGWISGSSDQPIAVLGGYGVGKSCLAIRVVAHQAKSALNDPTARRPILIKLGAFSRNSSLEGILGGMFTSEFPIQNFNMRRFLSMNEKGRLLFVLDGFDEMKHAMSWADFRSQVSELNRLIVKNARVLLLGRPSAFLSQVEHFHVLRGRKPLAKAWYRIPGWPEFREFDILDFVREERSNFVERYLNSIASANTSGGLGESEIAARSAKVNEIADLEPSLFAKPVHAKILTDLAADPDVDLTLLSVSVSRWTLYETFFASLLDRETEKEARRGISHKDRLKFLKSIAFWLWTREGDSIAFKISDIPSSVRSTVVNENEEDEDDILREYLVGSFLEKKSADIFYFPHRSFAEYLVAAYMVENPPSLEQHSLYARVVEGGVDSFLEEAPKDCRFHGWVASLGDARGLIHFPYIRLLVLRMGGVQEFVSQLPDESAWRHLMEAFGSQFIFDARVSEKIEGMMRASDDNSFFMYLPSFVVGLAQEYRTKPKSEFVDVLGARMSGLVLERLFRNAYRPYLEHTYEINDEFKETKDVAIFALSERQDEANGRYLTFRGGELMRRAHDYYQRKGTLYFGEVDEITLPDVQIPLRTALREIANSQVRSQAENFYRNNRALSKILVTGSLRPRRLP